MCEILNRTAFNKGSQCGKTKRKWNLNDRITPNQEVVKSGRILDSFHRFG